MIAKRWIYWFGRCLVLIYLFTVSAHFYITHNVTGGLKEVILLDGCSHALMNTYTSSAGTDPRPLFSSLVKPAKSHCMFISVTRRPCLFVRLCIPSTTRRQAPRQYATAFARKARPRLIAHRRRFRGKQVADSLGFSTCHGAETGPVCQGGLASRKVGPSPSPSPSHSMGPGVGEICCSIP